MKFSPESWSRSAEAYREASEAVSQIKIPTGTGGPTQVDGAVADALRRLSEGFERATAGLSQGLREDADNMEATSKDYAKAEDHNAELAQNAGL
uniref:hypothetical protein n=1 Tax=Tessaracoccus timonensis TaxID=2161816 RepID=UPI000D54B7BC|nr:hypothetical protein [Tessaracoccus timonensis]